MQKSQAIIVLTLVVSAMIAVTTFALLTAQWNMRGTGSVKGVGLGVYWDPQCTSATSLLEFGELEPASSKSFTLYLRNEGNSALTLNMTSENWDPANAADHMTLTWNREGQQIDPDEVMTCVITLSVSENIQGVSSFGLDIIIYGTG